MFRKFVSWLVGKPSQTAPVEQVKDGFFSAKEISRRSRRSLTEILPAFVPPKPVFGDESGLDAAETGQDGSDGTPSIKQGLNPVGDIGDAVVSWFLSQNFIGYQLCAYLAQHWLIDKACAMPGRDAVRNGYEITVNDGVVVDNSVLDFMRQRDKDYKIKRQLSEFVHKGRT